MQERFRMLSRNQAVNLCNEEVCGCCTIQTCCYPCSSTFYERAMLVEKLCSQIRTRYHTKMKKARNLAVVIISLCLFMYRYSQVQLANIRFLFVFDHHYTNKRSTLSSKKCCNSGYKQKEEVANPSLEKAHNHVFKSLESLYNSKYFASTM
jgi:hypothetical protein